MTGKEFNYVLSIIIEKLEGLGNPYLYYAEEKKEIDRKLREIKEELELERKIHNKKPT